MPNEVKASQKTAGEQLFEDYLRTVGYDFAYEQNVPGKPTHPDYLVTGAGHRILCEVKQFDHDNFPRSGAGSIDPYEQLREKINDARKQFKHYKGEMPCCLVVYSNNTFVQLEEQTIMLGAMYGDVGISIPIDIRGAAAAPPKQTFLGRGEMIRPHWKKAQNTTFSALITVRHVAIGRMRLDQWLKEHPLEPEGILGLTNDAVGFDISEMQLGVIVWENAFAAIRLPREMFMGTYDLRWGVEEDGQKIVYKGPGLP